MNWLSDFLDLFGYLITIRSDLTLPCVLLCGLVHGRFTSGVLCSGVLVWLHLTGTCLFNCLDASRLYHLLSFLTYSASKQIVPILPTIEWRLMTLRNKQSSHRQDPAMYSQMYSSLIFFRSEPMFGIVGGFQCHLYICEAIIRIKYFL